MKLTALIPAAEPFHTFEFFPPRTPQGLANLLDRIHRLISDPLRPPVAISVTWGAGGSTAVKSLELAHEIVRLVREDGKEESVQVVLHLTCTNMGRKLVDSALAALSPEGRGGRDDGPSEGGVGRPRVFAFAESSPSEASIPREASLLRSVSAPQATRTQDPKSPLSSVQAREHFRGRTSSLPRPSSPPQTQLSQADANLLFLFSCVGVEMQGVGDTEHSRVEGSCESIERAETGDVATRDLASAEPKIHPPRKEEYRPVPGPSSTSFTQNDTTGELDPADMLNEEFSSGDEEDEFTYAEDLVRYIRNREDGDWFCIGVAGYPTPHLDSPTPESDIHFLTEKVRAGADFIITQLFYDVDGFIRWVETVRRAARSNSACLRAKGVDVPIIPGLMPIQNYASFRRLINLCKCPVPKEIMDDLDPIKSDDAAVKRYGIALATKMIQRLLAANLPNVQGVHFCTLNLEKSVRTIMENLGWVVGARRQLQDGQENGQAEGEHRNRLIDQNETMAPNTGDPTTLGTSPSRQLMQLSISPQEAATIAENGFKHRKQHHPGGGLMSDEPSKGPHQSAPSAGGAGVVEDWDEYPNGRFTDVRSPAYGEIDGYGNGLKVTPTQALKDWGAPVDPESLSALFTSYLRSSPNTPTTPFCDLPISPESQNILHYLVHLNSPAKQMWTVGSQPAVDGARSDDPIHGFGPKGGYVFQKSFVEFFVPSRKEVEELAARIESAGEGGVIKFYAGNKHGDLLSNLEEEDVNSVTWAVFPGQEIVTSTQIQEESFLAWKEEAFEIWTEWSRLYPLRSASRKLLQGIADNAWLVSVIHHDYKDPEGLWRFLLGDDYEEVRQEGYAK
ncbi:hypothetical protein QFC19_006492 [Naganishia cerealis]|uniref:Uncharacterized protein n=1 Tax=Naganishia cerealis TaxID=610337 RepID=A0ACC2VHL3_9TREE|nr:hypothetical protein QFC19_006492 [Naganishia cerealis]